MQLCAREAVSLARGQTHDERVEHILLERARDLLVHDPIGRALGQAARVPMPPQQARHDGRGGCRILIVHGGASPTRASAGPSGARSSGASAIKPQPVAPWVR